MPKIYEYLGIVLYFFSNEHEPIHIHGKHDGRETKAEIILFNGVIKEIVLKDKGNRGLNSRKRKEFENFVTANASEIVDKWIDYFVKKKSIIPVIITKKVKNVRSIG